MGYFNAYEGYGNSGYGYPISYSSGNSFILIVVLFILLIIVGAIIYLQ
ncbi:YjcZ family sporulation protein [Aquibacillus halophilus]|uniref:YjcZ family sporulation protein n=1 Tax=Aquibacillus halophilus TaxID=930132 RepID=A0A6A8DN49_9BACI|nr:YjcZ family sporulation protein [Aquibacillus halophilus]MRH44457.1 YjcZ family sporulation protein [Aquibacillus halophilus]